MSVSGIKLMKVFSILWALASVLATYKTIERAVEKTDITVAFFAAVTALCIFLSIIKYQAAKKMQATIDKHQQQKDSE